MENKKFNFVLVHFTPATIHFLDEINQIALNNCLCDGIEEFALEEARVDEILGERAYSGGDVPETLLEEVEMATMGQAEVTLKYFFFEENFEKNTQCFLDVLATHFSHLPTYFTQKDFEDWNTEWRKFYAPIIVSERLEIIPEWLKSTSGNALSEKIYIYPGMGFGTGTHETTYLCLKLYDQIFEQLNSNLKCLDFGCGSGILGITALKTKKMSTHFCDIDKNALDNCVQNLILNFEGQEISDTTLVIRDRYIPLQFNVVFANILEAVLISEKNIILASVAPGGWVIVSGLLNNQVQNIVSEYHRLKMEKIVSKGDWSAILFRKEQ